MMEADPHIKAPTRRFPTIGIVVVFLPWCLIVAGPDAAAQIWNGSMRVDYQSTPVGGKHQGSLQQQYYLRMTDQLFYKNQITFIGTFDHRARQQGRPAEFRPRYQWLLTSAGYGGQLAYEPYTQKQQGVKEEEEINRRWRAGVFIQPERWPRLTYDLLRARRTQTERGTGRERWDSYMMTWQPRANALSAGYSRQVRSSQGSPAGMVEVYRALASSERPLPWHHRLSLGYNFDRTWSKRSAVEVNAQDQHTGTVNLYGDPVSTLNWSAQYSGRFLNVTRPGGIRERPTDHLATGAINWTPATAFSTTVSRYFARAGNRQGESGQRTDYWQGRATGEGRLYRQMRVLGTAYRIVYSGAPKGMRYSDAYFLALRGKPFRRTDWSAELSLGDRHGRQPDRFGGSVNIYARLEPLATAQTQIGYTALVSGAKLDNLRLSEESYNSNVQYVPTENMSISATGSVRRNRILGPKWDLAWAVTGTYRWPSFASLNFNYSERQNTAIPGTVVTSGPEQRPSTLLVSVVVWLGPSSTLNGQYTHQKTPTGNANENWGVSISTSF